MRKASHTIILPVILLAAAAGISFFVIAVSRNLWIDMVKLAHDPMRFLDSPSEAESPMKPSIAHALPSQETAPGEKWIVIMNVNSGFYEFFQNWWAYYRCLELDHEVNIIAEDDEVERTLKAANLPNVKVERNPLTNSPKSLVYGSEEYSKMMFARPGYILRHLKLGHNIITTDIDTGMRVFL